MFLIPVLTKELRPFVRIRGPLAALEELAPKFGECLTSAVEQVFGMMTNLDVVTSAGSANIQDAIATVVVQVDVNGRNQLGVELRIPMPLAKDLTGRMLEIDPNETAEEDCLSAAGELANMITGRLDAWLKERALPSHCSLPETRLAPPGESTAELPEKNGFVNHFLFPTTGLSFELSVRARDLLDQQ